MILIDMDMPNNCSNCPLLHYGEYGAFEKSWCELNSKIVILRKKRPEECPLMESEDKNETEI